MVELRRLRLLHEFVRLGTVAGVADALSFSPSSVSVQLGQLEREAGASLFKRAGRNIELTAAGHRLAEYAAEALAADEAVRAEIAAPGETASGRLTLSFVQTPAFALLPGLFAHLSESAPDLQVDVVQRETEVALEHLRSRRVDLVVGIEYDPVPVGRQRDLDRVDLIREDVLLAFHPSHPALRRPGPVALASLSDEPWASGHRGSGLDAVCRNVCNRVGGFEPDIRHRSDDKLVLGALVASRCAVALLPSLATRMRLIDCRRLREERLHRTIFTAARSTGARSPEIIAARDALRRAAEQAAAGEADLAVVA